VVEAQVPALKEGTVPNFTAAQAQLAEANRFPDREVTPSIKAGTIPGTIDIDLKVRDTLPFHAGVELNNDHNSATEPLRVGVSARYTNLWQLGHTISGTYLIAPQDISQLQVISGSYLAPILGSRWSVLAYGYTSNSNVAALGGTQVLGNGFAIGLRGIYRIPGSREQSIAFGIDYKDFKENIAIPDADPTRPPAIIETPIAYLPLVITYSTQFGGGGAGIGNVSIGMTAGIRGFGSNEAAVQVRRFDAIGNFVHLNLEADYTRGFGSDFAGYARFVAQIADSPLVTNEQFSVGGLTSVRGYFQSEAVGDSGVNGTLEMRSPSFAGNVGSFVDELRLFVFTDAGYVSVLSPLPDQQVNFTLVSVGGGARFQLARYLTGNIAYGVALTDGTETLVGDGQLVFSVKAEF
jgi:hemolysin activation/secretion protein